MLSESSRSIRTRDLVEVRRPQSAQLGRYIKFPHARAPTVSCADTQFCRSPQNEHDTRALVVLPSLGTIFYAGEQSLKDHPV